MPIPSAGRSSTPCAAEMPDVLDDLTAAGATVATLPDDRPVALLCRRILFEQVLRRAAEAQHGVALVTGHVDTLVQERGRAAGVTVDGRTVTGDVIIDASGRASRFTGDVRPPAQGGDCGAVYVTRQYRLRRDAAPGPVNSPIGLSFGLLGLPRHRVRPRRRPLLDHVHPRRQRHPAATAAARRGVRRRRARDPAAWRSGSNRHGRNRSRPPCPAGGCTTPTEGNSTRRAGRCCPV